MLLDVVFTAAGACSCMSFYKYRTMTGCSGGVDPVIVLCCSIEYYGLLCGDTRFFMRGSADHPARTYPEQLYNGAQSRVVGYGECLTQILELLLGKAPFIDVDLYDKGSAVLCG